MSLSFKQADGSDSPRLPLDLALLISDSLEAPATFLLVQQLSLALKAKRRCIVVGVANSFEYYAALLRKQSVQLVSEREKGNFVYLDAAKLLSSDANASQHICDHLASNISPDCLVIIDDYAALLYAGEDPKKLLRSFRKMRSMVRKHSGSLITVYHDDAFSPGKSNIERHPEDLFLLRNLLQLSDIWIQTRSLRAQMTGELAIHRAPALKRDQALETYTVHRPLQYKLEEGTLANFFVKGTGKGFL